MSDEFYNDYYNKDEEQVTAQVSEEQPKKKSHMLRNILISLLALVLIVAAGGGALYATGFFDRFNNDDDTTVAAKDDDDAEESKSKSEETTEGVTLTSSEGAKTALTTATTVDTTTSVSASLLDVSAVVEEVMPSVVAVTNDTIYTVTSSQWSWYGNSSSYEYPASGAGSGVIIGQNDEELLIVTNAHVVLPTDYSSYGYTVESSKITITFIDEATVEAYVKGYDEDADLAVIGVKLGNITDSTLSQIKIATIGNSDELKAGNGVIAIGNALGFGQSVTVGYVSALNREVTIDNVTRTLLQTDAAINPGNSGGGLFNTNGQLIGINSAKYSSEDVEGIGYAIPITSAAEIIEKLMNTETVIREKVTDEDKMAYIGIYNSREYSSSYGVLIGDIVEDGPADQAGLASYDIITAINGTSVTTWSQLVNELAYYEGGETVTITYYTIEGKGRDREYVEKETEVTLGFKKDFNVEDK